ncbi:hypothetical protein RFI_11429, partial [Reticulomyxa filosa]
VGIWVLSFQNSYYFDDNQLSVNLNLNNVLKIDIIDIWATVSTHMDMNVPHFHPNSDLSGVVYINIPDSGVGNDNGSGDLYFVDPRTRLVDGNVQLPFGEFNEPLKVKPVIGDILLFPNWLNHWVSPSFPSSNNTSNDTIAERISVAFNVKFDTNTDESLAKRVSPDEIVFLNKNPYFSVHAKSNASFETY